jgi:hypothetical protein
MGPEADARESCEECNGTNVPQANKDSSLFDSIPLEMFKKFPALCRTEARGRSCNWQKGTPNFLSPLHLSFAGFRGILAPA